MIKALIADDEIWVASLIRKSIDWETFEIEIVGEAHDGEDAFNKILSLKPDIVITDIRMPGISGIDLMEKVRLSGLSVEFIILSGYNSFEYAKEAIKYSAVSFILKPLEPEELEQALTVAIERIAKNSASTARADVNGQVEELRNSFLLKSLYSEHLSLPAIPLEEINTKYCCKFSYGNFFVVVAYLSQPLNQSSLDQFISVSDKLLKPMVSCHYCLYDNSRFIILINTSFSPDDDYDNLTKQLLEKLCNVCRADKLDIVMSIGPMEGTFSNINQSFKIANHLLRNRFTQGFGRIYKQNSDPSSNVHMRMLLNKELQIATMIETFQTFELELYLNNLIDQTIELSSDAEKLFFVLERVFDVYTRSIDRMGISDFKSFGLCSNFSEIIDSCNTKSELKKTLVQILIEPIKQYYIEQLNQDVHITARIKAYIGKHYKENIRLIDIADHLCRNPSYIGSVFKKDIGIGFSEYISTYRVDVSKTYLAEPSFSISQIADMVGFSDVRHFSKTFKKIVGITPAEYRKKSIR